MNERICYNEEPMLEVGKWKILCPNMFGKKFKAYKNPLLIHTCPKEVLTGGGGFTIEDTVEGEIEREYWNFPDREDDCPKCTLCLDPIPDEIQGLLAMYYMEVSDE